MAPQKDPKYEGAPPLAPIDRKSLRSGLLCESAVGENDRPETSVMAVENMHFDDIGVATLRKGTLLFADSNNFGGGAMLGMHMYIDVPGNHNLDTIIVAEGSNIWINNNNTGGWNSEGAGSGPGGPFFKTRFATFLNEVFAVNGGDPMQEFDPNVGNFVENGTNTTDAPVATTTIELFQSRLWTMGDPNFPSRLYYSTVPSAQSTPTITWNTDVTTGNWIDISPQDGDFPTALQRFRTQLLVFKTNRLYRVFGIGQVDADPWYGVGTSSQESVIETKVGVFFHHASGIYLYDVYGTVQEVSRPVIDFIRAISPLQYPYITGYLELDADHVVWAIGDVYITSPWQAGTGNADDFDPSFGGSKATFYHNCELRYTISTQVWTVYTKPYAATTSLRRQPFATQGNGEFEIALVGTNGGRLISPDWGVADNGDDSGSNNVAIPYSLTHRWENLDGLNSTRITVQNITFAHIGGAGTNVAYQTEENDPDNLHDWTKRVGKGVFVNRYTVFTAANIKGRKMRIRISGKASGNPFIYHGYEVIDAQAEFYNFPSN